MELKGVVTSPQFDTKFFTKGSALRITSTTYGGQQWEKDCLIISATPLELKVGFIDSDGDLETHTISISDITSEHTKITFFMME